MRASRSYKLQLSGKGVDAFLACHCRLARLTREFIPYGLTLYVAMSILDSSDPADIAAELESPDCAVLGGKSTRFVGATTRLAELVDRISRRLAESGQYGRPVATWRLYNAGLSLLLSLDDAELEAMYESASMIIPVKRAR